MGSAVAITRFGAPPQQDFFTELVAGAPGAPNGAGSGVARWVPISGGASVPLDATDFLTVSSPLTTASGFGAALASGNIYGVGQPVGLAVGAPDNADGSVCVVGVDTRFSVVQPNGGGSSPMCGASPYTGSTPHRWGATVAVGNVVPRDVYGQASSDAATIEEVIVGAPGADRSTWSKSGDDYTATSTGSSTGQVAVLQAIYEDGPVLPDGSPISGEARPRADLSSGLSGSEFGAALVVADLQRSDHADIIAGAPGWAPFGSSDEYGAVQLLNSDSVAGFSAAEGGIFEATDSDDRLVDAIVFGSDDQTYLSTGDDVFFIAYVKDDGSVCRLWNNDMSALFGLNLNLAHTLGDGDSTTLEDLILDTSTGELVGSHQQSTGRPLMMDLTITDANFDTSATDQVSITIANVRQHVSGQNWASIYGAVGVPGIANECDIENGPTFAMPRTQTWDASCE